MIKAIKYFDIDGGTDENGNQRVWHCQALSHSRYFIMDENFMTYKSLLMFFKSPNTADLIAEELEKKFKEFGDVKCVKLSYSPRVVNNIG